MLKYVEYTRPGDDITGAKAVAERAVVRKLAKDKSLTVVANIAETGGSSVRAGSRPGFDHLVDYLKSGSANAILCMHMGKLTRNAVDSALLSKLFDDGTLAEIRTAGGTMLTPTTDRLTRKLLLPDGPS